MNYSPYKAERISKILAIATTALELSIEKKKENKRTELNELFDILIKKLSFLKDKLTHDPKFITDELDSSPGIFFGYGRHVSEWCDDDQILDLMYELDEKVRKYNAPELKIIK